jgi:hypothetical protein
MPASRSIDGIQHREAAVMHRPLTPFAIPTGGKLQHTGAPAANQPKPKQPRPRPFLYASGTEEGGGFMRRLQLPMLIMGGIIAGYLVQSLWFGIPAIILYGILAVIFHIDSRVTFALAFISLLTVPVLLLAKTNVELASNFATYTFLLLVFGVIALSLEAMPKGRGRKRRNGR